MVVKKLALLAAVAFCMSGCNNETEKGQFTLTGDVKNIPDQDVYLEQLFFSHKNPEVMDTTQIKNGKFKFTAKAHEEGLYRIRMEKSDAAFIFINDAPAIYIKVDIKDQNNDGQISGPANTKLKNFMKALEEKRKSLMETGKLVEKFTNENNDSSYNVEYAKLFKQEEDYKNYITHFIDTASDPIVTMFALGYTRNIDPSLLMGPVSRLSKRFPNHQGISAVIGQYNEMMANYRKREEMLKNAKPDIGMMAPEIVMNDVNDQPFSLSRLKGKYVLVDFWASWCGPCRGENPNVVAAYNKYKNKNFTVLGVSLDESKEAWIKAIKDDNLTWNHISDLKGWYNAAVSVYKFEGIPYNVLVDTSGKIIATNLREAALGQFLEKTLK